MKERKAFTQKALKQDTKSLKKDLQNSGIISTLQTVIEYELLPSDQPILIHHSSIGDKCGFKASTVLEFFHLLYTPRLTKPEHLFPLQQMVQ